MVYLLQIWSHTCLQQVWRSELPIKERLRRELGPRWEPQRTLHTLLSISHRPTRRSINTYPNLPSTIGPPFRRPSAVVRLSPPDAPIQGEPQRKWPNYTPNSLASLYLSLFILIYPYLPFIALSVFLFLSIGSLPPDTTLVSRHRTIFLV